MTSWVFAAFAAVLGAILLWGVIAPRAQWRVLVGWSASDPAAAEPGAAVHGVRRLLSGLGLVALLAILGAQAWSLWGVRAPQAAEALPLERMWGDPTPRLVDRIITAVDAPPPRLVAGAIVGYQEFAHGYAPAYLVQIPRFQLLGESDPAGLIGGYPGDGFTAYGSADLLIAAEGPLLCIPRAALVVEAPSAVTVAVYWGLPGGGEQDHSACADPGALAQTVLIPVRLPESLGSRSVITPDGAPVREIPILGER